MLDWAKVRGADRRLVFRRYYECGEVEKGILYTAWVIKGPASAEYHTGDNKHT